MNLRNYVVIAALLLAAPLAAQQTQTTVVPDVEITVNGDTIVVNVEVLSDSVKLARIADAMESIAAAIEAQGCDQCGGASTTAKLGLGLAVPILLWIAVSLHKSAGKDDVHNVNNEITVPPREKRHGESPG